MVISRWSLAVRYRSGAIGLWCILIMPLQTGGTVSRWSLAIAFLMTAGGGSFSQSPATPAAPARISVRNVTFIKTGMLSLEEQKQIEAQLKKPDNPQMADLWGSAVEALQVVRAAYSEHGYFKVGVTAMITPVSEPGDNRQVDVNLNVINDGEQYWLREIRFTHATAFPEQQMLSVIPLRAGDVFLRDKVAKGLQALRALYAANGYLNFASTSETEFDDGTRGISLHIDVNEGSQFQFRNLSLAGLDEIRAREVELEWEQLKGQAYSPELLRNFYSKCFGPLPAGVDPLQYGGGQVDVAAHAVDIHISFLPESTSGEVGHY
jgi:surface antigen-like variable number repeat protein